MPLNTACRQAEVCAAKVPWSIARGPSYWEERLSEHYRQRGVNVTGAYTRHGLAPSPIPDPAPTQLEKGTSSGAHAEDGKSNQLHVVRSESTGHRARDDVRIYTVQGGRYIGKHHGQANVPVGFGQIFGPAGC